jgi:hypothetical protein
MGNNTVRRGWLSSRRVTGVLFGISLLVGIAGVLLQQAPG